MMVIKKSEVLKGWPLTKVVLALGLAAILAMSFTGCSKQGAVGAQEDKPTVITGQLQDFTMDIPSKYREKSKEESGIFFTTTYEAEDGRQIRIMEEKNATYTVDEKYLEEELTVVDEIETLRTEVLDLAGFGKVYGALIEDHSLEKSIFYYKFQTGETTGTVLFVNIQEYTEQDEANVKAIIASLKARAPQ